MTLRNLKRLFVVLISVLLLLSAMHVGLILWLRVSHPDYAAIALPLFAAVMLLSIWRRLSALEAQHGSDYVAPTSPSARKILIVVGLVAVALGAIVAYLVATR